MKSLKIKYLWLLLVLLLPVLCFAEKCPGFNIREYKPDESCGYLERKCCISKSYYDMGEWSDWGGECAPCTPGEYWKLPCSFYYNDPNYYGWEAFTCNSDSKWEAYTPATSCTPPEHLQFMFHSRTPENYHFTSSQNCNSSGISLNGPAGYLLNLKLEKEEEGSYVDTSYGGVKWIDHILRSDVVEVMRKGVYTMYGIICFSHELSDGTIEYVPAEVKNQVSTCASCESSWDNPRIIYSVGGDIPILIDQ